MNRQQKRAALSKVRATRNEWEPLECMTRDHAWVIAHAARIGEHIARTGDLRACWRNNRYSVQVFGRDAVQPGSIQLAIRHHDGRADVPWSDLQRIKNEVMGIDAVAIEVYPAESDVVDNANMRHLFVLPAGESVPFTIKGRWE